MFCFSYSYGWYFSGAFLFSCLVISYWIPNIVNFTLLGAVLKESRNRSVLVATSVVGDAGTRLSLVDAGEEERKMAIFWSNGLQSPLWTEALILML